jgi:hypothetical protein
LISHDEGKEEEEEEEEEEEITLKNNWRWRWIIKEFKLRHENPGLAQGFFTLSREWSSFWVPGILRLEKPGT